MQKEDNMRQTSRMHTYESGNLNFHENKLCSKLYEALSGRTTNKPRTAFKKRQ